MLISARGIRLNVIDRGDGNPIVFLHGVGCNAHYWGPQLEALAGEHRVVAVDTRGFGMSDRTYGDMELQDYADDILIVLTKIGIEKAVFVGLSMGGILALTIAASAPERVAGLVLSGATAIADEAMRTAMAGAQQGVSMIGMGAVSRMQTTGVYSAEATQAGHAYVRDAQEAFGSTDDRCFLIACAALEKLDLTAALPTITAPTLVLWGEEDGIASRENSERIARSIPGAELGIMAGAAHIANLDQSEAFTGHIRDLVQKAKW